MASESNNFEWLGAGEAEQLLRKKLSEQVESPDLIDLSVIGWPGAAQEHELLAQGDEEPKGYVRRNIADAQRHLDSLWVVGASKLSDEEIRQIGPFLAREDSYREDAVFQILARRRAEAPAYMRPFITVKKEHILLFGLGSQAGRISLEGIQRENISAAQAQLGPLVEIDEFEDTFLYSDMMRRVLRSIYYIINEPTQSSALLLERFKRQVEEHGPLSAEELVARTYNFTQNQYENHIKSHPTTMETEENLVQLLEEGRLQRLKNLGSTVLVAGLGIITAGEYSDS
jgi:hypothetical protein